MIRLIVGAIVGGVLSVGPSAAEAADGPVAIKAITHNIAGGAIHNGDWRALSTVERKIKRQNPDVVMLQEVCASQLESLKRWHPDWSFAWAENTDSHNACDGDPASGPVENVEGDELGDVLMSRRALSNVQATVLPHSGDADGRGWTRWQHLLCGDFTKAGHVVRACSTHVMIQRADPVVVGNADQVRTIASMMAPYRRRGPVVIGGDFNAGPKTANVRPMWDRFLEVNRDTRWRIDYLWYGGLHNGRDAVKGSLSRNTVSDHPIVWGAGYARKG